MDGQARVVGEGRAPGDGSTWPQGREEPERAEGDGGAGERPAGWQTPAGGIRWTAAAEEMAAIAGLSSVGRAAAEKRACRHSRCGRCWVLAMDVFAVRGGAAAGAGDVTGVVEARDDEEAGRMVD